MNPPEFNGLNARQILEALLAGNPEPGLVKYMHDRMQEAAGNPQPPLNGRRLLEAILQRGDTVNGEVWDGRNE